MIGTLATAFIIRRQARLLHTQNQFEALTGLNARWDSLQLLKLRNAWAQNEGVPSTEAVLEFLEEFAALKDRSVLKKRQFWYSVLGWYAAHYFIYNQDNGNIGKIREKWGDRSLYGALKGLTSDYLAFEAREMKERKEEVRERILRNKDKFKEDEQRRYELCL